MMVRVVMMTPSKSTKNNILIVRLYEICNIYHYLLWYFVCKWTNKNIAPSIPATDEYHGIKVVDEYRNLEDLKDPATINWMKSQTDYTNSVLSQIPKKNFYLEKDWNWIRGKGT